MAKAIFRVSGIKTTSDLRGIGKHNVDRISETNFDIDRERSNENITLKNCGGNYGLRFEKITRDLKIQHDEQMKTTRKSRQKSFLDKVNEDKADVACEFLMSA
ncbi:MAG TPA: plasmid recombination protein, partial [Sporosarcina sp.]|nr:plasmid recombination protein [Sporosarcina sp.]